MDDLTKRQWEIVLSCADCGITDQDDQRAAIAAVEKFAAWLAAADREAPDEGVWPDQSAVHGVLLEQIKDAYAEGITDTVAKLRVRAAEMLPEVARFTLDEIEALAAADREKPDGCHAPHCWSEYGTPCGTCPVAAASPDERLREALREIVAAFPSPPDREMDDEEIEKWYADHGDWFQRLAALAAADREAPDEGVWPDQSAVHGVLLEQIKDAYAEGITDTVAKLRVRAAEVLPVVARFTLDEIEAICADREAPDECQHLSCYGDGETLICIDCEQIVPPDDPKETTT